MLTRQQKEEQVAELKDKFERATSVFVADYQGLGVAQMEALRGGQSAEQRDVRRGGHGSTVAT